MAENRGRYGFGRYYLCFNGLRCRRSRSAFGRVGWDEPQFEMAMIAEAYVVIVKREYPLPWWIIALVGLAAVCGVILVAWLLIRWTRP